jgi:Glycine zipper
MKMNTKDGAIVATARNFRIGIVTLACAVALIAATGCGSPRANDTLLGGALGAGAGALIGGSEGSPGTGALIGGLGGGAVGYIVGTETEHYNAEHYGYGYGYPRYGYRPYYGD